MSRSRQRDLSRETNWPARWKAMQGRTVRRRTRTQRVMARTVVPRTVVPLVALILLLLGGTAAAAEIQAETAGEDVFRLPRGEVVQDDFYVSGREVYIDGTVDGDLVVAGAYVEVNGVVTGDLIAAGGSIVVSGVVQDDARLAGGGVVVSGNIGDDLFAAAGGGWPGAELFMARMGAPTIAQGLTVAGGAKVGGDANIVGGEGSVEGAVGGDLAAAFGTFRFSGQVSGSADLTASNMTIAPGSRVERELRYSAPQQLNVPEAVAPVVQYEATETQAPAEAAPLSRFPGWLARTLLILVGLAIVGWLVATFAPRTVTQPVAAIETRPAESLLYGLVAAVVFVPLAAAVVFLAVLFWGWFPGGIVVAAFLFGLFALVWILSPLVTGLWIGRRLAASFGMGEGMLSALLIGALAIALLARLLGAIPCVGGAAAVLLYLFSFAFAIGGWILARRQAAAAPAGILVPQS